MALFPIRGEKGDVCGGGVRVPRRLRLSRRGGRPCGQGHRVGHALHPQAQASPEPPVGGTEAYWGWGTLHGDCARLDLFVPWGGSLGALGRRATWGSPSGRRDACHLRSTLPLSCGQQCLPYGQSDSYNLCARPCELLGRVKLPLETGPGCLAEAGFKAPLLHCVHFNTVTLLCVPVWFFCLFYVMYFFGKWPQS